MEDLQRHRAQLEAVPISEFLKEQEPPVQKEPRSFSREKMKLNLKVNFELPRKNTSESLLDEIKSVEINVNCIDHPDEELQFYSFTNDKALCSECVLSGLYTGCEVLSLKKAADRIKPKFQQLLEEIAGKVDQLKTLQDKIIGDKTISSNDPVARSREDIKDQFDKLRAAIDKKEREILEKFDKENAGKHLDGETKQQILKETQEQVIGLQGVLADKFKVLKEASFCQYYASKVKLVKNYLNEEYAAKIRDLTQPTNSASFRNPNSGSEYSEGINRLVEAVNNLKDDNEQKDLRSEFHNFQSRLTRDLEKETAEMLMENPVTSPPSLLKLMSNISCIDEPSEMPVRTRSVSPFRALKKELEIISPMPVTKESHSPGTGTEETLRKLLERVEDMKKSSQLAKDNEEKRREAKGPIISKLPLNNLHTQSMARLNLLEGYHTQSNPKLLQMESIKEKDPSARKFWDNYKDIVEDQSSKKSMLTYSTTKLIEPERNKPAPKSFLTDFTKPKLSTQADVFSVPVKKELFPSASSQGLSTTSGLASTKNLRTLIPDDGGKQTPAWKLQAKREEVKYASTGNSTNSKSFGMATNTLSINLRKLKREMGLDE